MAMATVATMAMAMTDGGDDDDWWQWYLMTSAGELVSPDCTHPPPSSTVASLYTPRGSAGNTPIGKSARQDDAQTRKHADPCGVARGIWCADVALNQQRLNIPSYKINCKSLGILDRAGLGCIT